MAKPVVDRLERDLAGEMRVLRLSVLSGVGRQLAGRYSVRGVPTFLLFDRAGEMVHYQVGRLDVDQIKVEIELLER
ncbi:MAG: thioredoxin family protein [Anaerolineae bacterium]|nr:thioredoxin family protein [Anaerolineae bacterium]